MARSRVVTEPSNPFHVLAGIRLSRNGRFEDFASVTLYESTVAQYFALYHALETIQKMKTLCYAHSTDAQFIAAITHLAKSP